jgi:hypothetical protein
MQTVARHMRLTSLTSKTHKQNLWARSSAQLDLKLDRYPKHVIRLVDRNIGCHWCKTAFAEEVDTQLATMRLRSGTVTKVTVKRTTRKSEKTKGRSFKPAKGCSPGAKADKAGLFKPTNGCALEPSNLPSLELGPNGKLVHLPDASAWASTPSMFFAWKA